MSEYFAELFPARVFSNHPHAHKALFIHTSVDSSRYLHLFPSEYMMTEPFLSEGLVAQTVLVSAPPVAPPNGKFLYQH